MNIKRLLVAFLFIGLLLPQVSQARFKCWKNSEGVRECGETVPPEYSQQGHEEINKSGITVDKKDRAKTEDELAEEKRLAKEEKAKAKIQKEKDNQDRILLETFSNVDDIEMTRDGKIAAIENNIHLSNRRIGKIQEDLDKRIAVAAEQERSGNEPSEELLKDIESLQRQIKNNEEFIAQKRGEQEALRESYAKDIARFNELKKINSN